MYNAYGIYIYIYIPISKILSITIQSDWNKKNKKTGQLQLGYKTKVKENPV